MSILIKRYPHLFSRDGLATLGESLYNPSRPGNRPFYLDRIAFIVNMQTSLFGIGFVGSVGLVCRQMNQTKESR